jgi:hypothetical protein
MKIKNILIMQLIIVLVVGVGWVKNIIKLSNCDFEAPYKCEVIHAVGIIPPVGMITGWLDVGK